MYIGGNRVQGQLLLLLLTLLSATTASAQSWTKKADFINGGSGNAYSFTINDTIYVGNTGAVGFYKYDYTTDTWSPKANVPTELDNRTASRGFAIGGKGYVVGGIGPGGTCRSDVWEYTPGTDTWVQKADFPGGKRAGMGSFVVGSMAYIGGGYDTIDIPGFSLTPKNDFWQYNPATDSWTPKTNLPYPASYLLAPTGFSIYGKGYFACGDRATLTAGVYHDTDVNTLYEYDTTADTWTKKADFPGLSRSGAIAFVLNNKAIFGTGIKDSSTITCYNDFYTYDPVPNTWTPLSLPPFATRTYALAATVSTGKAYIGTGWQAPSVSVYHEDWWEYKLLPSDVVTRAEERTNIYPNPCSNELTIQLSENKRNGTTYAIYNMIGQKIQEGLIPANNKIATAALTACSYLLTLENNSGVFYKTVITKLE